MKRKLLLFCACVSAFALSMTAQTTVSVNAAAPWTGYANVFFNGAYQFGNSWALADLKTTINTENNSLELYPNYNTYNPNDSYWSNGELGNKTFEGNTFVESTTFAGQTLTFTGQVTSNTFAAGYEALAFIKGLNPATGYSLDVYVHAPLVTGETFSITANDIPAGLIVQYGFSVTGLNANPAHAAAIGNAVVTEAPLAVGQFNKSKMSVYPNPSSGLFQIHSAESIEKITVFNTIGQQVLAQNQNNTIDLTEMPSGLYVAAIVSAGSTTTVKLQKN